MRKELRNSLLLILTALIWGIAFVAQREGGAEVGPYTFNCIRSLIGAAVLFPVIKLLDCRTSGRNSHAAVNNKQLWMGGAACGIVLFVASTFQQLGMYYGTTAGKAGFLTACYILIVPLLGLFLGKKCRWNIWVGVLIALTGLYFLCLTDDFTVQLSDVLVLLCAVSFAVHILIIDHFSPLVDGVRLSCIQFLVCGVLGIIPMIWVDMQHSAAGANMWLESLTTWETWLPVLYAGVLSCGVGYTFQVIGQDGIHPTIASLLMSLESVFSVLAGMIILHETMSAREGFGCVLVFAAVLFAQIPFEKGNKGSIKEE